MEDFEEHLAKPKKRRLTQKQKDALAEGKRRAKVKREQAIIQETRAKQRLERMERQKIVDEQKEIEIYNRLMKKGNDKISNWKKIKYKYMALANSMSDYNELKEVVQSITSEDVLTGKHVEYLKEVLDSYTNPPLDPEDMESELPTIEEEDEVEYQEEDRPLPPLLEDPRDIRMV